jgi:hypothetical protein
MVKKPPINWVQIQILGHLERIDTQNSTLKQIVRPWIFVLLKMWRRKTTDMTSDTDITIGSEMFF